MGRDMGRRSTTNALEVRFPRLDVVRILYPKFECAFGLVNGRNGFLRMHEHLTAYYCLGAQLVKNHTPWDSRLGGIMTAISAMG